jgi:mono/diheme cytochrome c family protein
MGVALVVGLAGIASVAAQAPSGSEKLDVWDGVYSTEQAARGRVAFGQNCATCHGDDLKGGEGKPLIGDPFWTDWRETTVDYLLNRITTAMPFSEDGSLAGTLPASTYADLVAYILSRNDLPAGARELTRASSAGVPIIGKDGPGALPASTLARVFGCLAPRGANREWSLSSGTQLGSRQYALKFVLKSLDKFVGHRMVVTGLLLGDGGVDGLNVSTIDTVSETCK